MLPWQNVTTEYFMNVPPVSPGTYPGIVELQYAGETKRIDVQFNVRALSDAELQTPAAAKAANVSVTLVRLLILAVVIIIIFLYWRRRKKEKENND
jgi:hypothetical protein